MYYENMKINIAVYQRVQRMIGWEHLLIRYEYQK